MAPAGCRGQRGNRLRCAATMPASRPCQAGNYVLGSPSWSHDLNYEFTSIYCVQALSGTVAIPPFGGCNLARRRARMDQAAMGQTMNLKTANRNDRVLKLVESQRRVLERIASGA